MVGWKYETAGDQQIKELRTWMKKQHNELVEDIQTALDYAGNMRIRDVKGFLKVIKRRISVRRDYIRTNFGYVGAMSFYGGTPHPKPDLITGNEKK